MSMLTPRAVRVCACAWLTAVSPASAAASAPATQLPPDVRIQALVDEWVDIGGAVGIVVGVLDDDGEAHVFHAGTAGEGARPLSAGTVFEIGSITKVFTATLLAEMALRGEVSVDGPLQRYLAGGATMAGHAASPVTLQHLATHQAGLPHTPDNMPMANLSDPHRDYTPALMREFLARYDWPDRAGSHYRYSNLGPALLGQILADRLGLGYDEAVRQRVLEPLGMSMTGVEPDPTMYRAMARGHDVGGESVPGWHFAALAGAGGIHSTAEDLLRFVAAHLEEPWTPLRHAMRYATAPRAELDREWRLGLGWFVRVIEEQRIVWHDGRTSGFRSFLAFDPDRGIGVVVLANSDTPVADLGFHLLNPELPASAPRPPSFAHRPELNADSQDLKIYTGRYFLTPEADLRIGVADGRLYARLPGRMPNAVYAAGPGSFFLRALDMEIEFEADEAGEVQAAVLRTQGHRIWARRVPEG